MAKQITPAPVPANEVIALFTQEHPVVRKAEQFVVTKSNLSEAAEFVIEIERASAAAEEEKRKALNLILALEKVERGRWKQFEDSVKKASEIMRGKVVKVNEELRQIGIKVKAALEAKVESGRLKDPEKIAAKLEAIQEPERRIVTSSGTFTEKTHQTVKVVDVNLIPRRYLVPDMVKIRKDALANIQIPGVEVVNEIRTSVATF